MKWLKFAFRHKQSDWRCAGIQIARTFFHLKEAKNRFGIVDFIGSVLLITLPDEAEDGEEHEFTEEQKKKQEKLQLLAADTLCVMADHKEFEGGLTSTSVLNFLCIVLNQVKTAVDTVTHTFVKLSENPDNLVVLMECAVGDILESFFKRVKYVRPPEDETELLEQ